jgi:hypothetical protein
MSPPKSHIRKLNMEIVWNTDVILWWFLGNMDITIWELNNSSLSNIAADKFWEVSYIPLTPMLQVKNVCKDSVSTKENCLYQKTKLFMQFTEIMFIVRIIRNS